MGDHRQKESLIVEKVEEATNEKLNLPPANARFPPANARLLPAEGCFGHFTYDFSLGVKPHSSSFPFFREKHSKSASREHFEEFLTRFHLLYSFILDFDV